MLTFNESYPLAAPQATFVPVILHPNVYPSGNICLSILNEGWRPAMTVKTLLLGIQELLATPNLNSPAQSEAYDLLRKQPKEYERRVRAYAATVASPILGKALPVKNLVSKSAGVL